jgi:hypothetical protein
MDRELVAVDQSREHQDKNLNPSFRNCLATSILLPSGNITSRQLSRTRSTDYREPALALRFRTRIAS